MVKVFLCWLATGTLCPALVICALLLNPVAAGELETIAVEITTHLGDQQTFVEGDVISFLLSLDRDAYIYLFYEDASAKIYQIFPNQMSRNHFYREGFYVPIPPSKNDFQFKIQAPFGEEKLFVFATDIADIKINARRLVNGLSIVDASVGEIEAGFRRQSSLRYGSASLTIKSRSR